MEKTTKLLELIRKAVREEVRTAVREELNEVLGEKKLTKENIEHGINLVDLQNSPKNPHEQGTQKPGSKQDFTFSKDPVLNKILNETASDKDNWKTMGNKTFEATDGKAGLAAALGYGDFGAVKDNGKPTLQDMIPNDRKHVRVSDEMADVLTRDYSKLMKKVDEKTKKSRATGSPIAPQIKG